MDIKLGEISQPDLDFAKDTHVGITCITKNSLHYSNIYITVVSVDLHINKNKTLGEICWKYAQAPVSVYSYEMWK